MEKPVCKIIAAAIFLGLLWNCSTKDPLELYQLGEKAAQQGDNKKAYEFFIKAIKQNESDPKFHKAAALASSNSNAKYIHAQNAWDLGYKTPEILMLITHNILEVDKSAKLARALALFEDLPGKLKTEELRGDIHYWFGDPVTGREIWEGAFTKEGAPGLCLKYAVSWQQSMEPNKIGSSLEFCREKGWLDAPGYSMLALWHANLFHESKVREIFEEGLKIVEQTDPLRLEQGRYFLSRGDIAAALKALEPLAHDPSNSIFREASLILGYLYALKGDQKSLRDLIEAHKNNKSTEIYFNLMVKKSTAGGMLSYEDALELHKNYPSSSIAMQEAALAHKNKGNFAQAAAILDKLRNFPASAPEIITLKSFCLAKAGHPEQALKYLAKMHESNVMTKSSLQLMSEIFTELGQAGKSATTQKLMWKLFPGDSQLLAQKGEMEFKQKKFSHALKTFSSLKQNYPENQTYLYKIIAIHSELKNYSQVISLCKNSNLPDTLIASLYANALHQQGKSQEAVKVFSEATRKTKTARLHLQFALFLINQKQLEPALKHFKIARANPTSEFHSNPAAYAALLNNFAWELTQTSPYYAQDCIEAAKLANQLIGENPFYLDTYSFALLKAELSHEAIKELNKSRVTQSEPILLYRLAKAYELSRDRERALRTYKKAQVVLSGPIPFQLPIPPDSISLSLLNLNS